METDHLASRSDFWRGSKGLGWAGGKRESTPGSPGLRSEKRCGYRGVKCRRRLAELGKEHRTSVIRRDCLEEVAWDKVWKMRAISSPMHRLDVKSRQTIDGCPRGHKKQEAGLPWWRSG